MTIKSVADASPLEDDFVLLQVTEDAIKHARALFCAAWHNNERAIDDAATQIEQFLLKPSADTDEERRVFLQQIYDALKPTSKPQSSWFSFFSRSGQSRVETCPLWDSIELFLLHYKTEDRFEGFSDILTALDQACPSICRVVSLFLLQPPRSFMLHHAGNHYVRDFLYKLLSKDNDAQFLFTSACKNEAWPEAPFVLLEVLIEREDASVSAILRSLLERILDPVQQSKELLTLIQKLLRRDVHINHYPLIVDVLSEKLRRFANSIEVQLLKYVTQFLQLPRELHGLESRQFVIQAAFMARYREPYNKKQVYTPRSTIRDSRCYVLSKRKVTVLNASGVFKRVTSALGFLPDSIQPPILVAQSVSSCRNDRMKAVLTKEQIVRNYTLALREAEFATELRGIPEIVQLQSKVTYEKTIPNVGKVPVVSLIWEYYPSNLDEQLSKNTVSGADKKQIAIDLINGLIAMHDKELFHWDIKGVNILCHRQGQALRAVWCDFGMMFRKSETVDIMKKYHVGNTYGSLAYMAPELFVMAEFPRENFVDILVKAEIWALGKVLYELYSADQLGCGKTPWQQPLFQLYNSHSGDLLSLFPQLHREIVERFGHMQTGQSAILDVITSMLHPNPGQRPSLLECLHRIQG